MDFDAVVEPLPDEAALETVVLLEEFPVVGEASVAIAHRVRVFAGNERTFPLSLERPFFDKVVLGVHRADDV